MSYGSWVPYKARESLDFFEKAYRRESLPTWDAKWHVLSVPARSLFLQQVKRPAKPGAANSSASGVPADRFPSEILQELTAAGFVEVVAAKSRGFSDSVITNDAIYDFVMRLQAIQRYHLLAVGKSDEFRAYVNYAFDVYGLTRGLSSVLRHQQIRDGYYRDEIIKSYVTHYRWMSWVAAALEEPLAEKVLDLIRQAEGPVPLAELPGRIPGSDPAVVRTVLDKLITHLALVEDLDPKTGEILVGILPAVREQLVRAKQPCERAPLLVCEQPKEVGPSGSLIVNDLRAVLLEMASDPPRIRQDQSLFAKEAERFQSVQEPLAGWLRSVLQWPDELRVSLAIAWARALQLVEEVAEGKQFRLSLNAKGQQWLSSDLEEQYQEIYNLLKVIMDRNSAYHYLETFTGFDPVVTTSDGDMRFLGEAMTVLRLEKGNRPLSYRDAKAADYQALRTTLDEALAVLKPGVFYRWDSVRAHLVDRNHNPLNRGLKPDQVSVYWRGGLIPPREDQREEAGRHLLDTFLRKRLIPLGCFQVAIDEDDRICVARGPRFDAYFDRAIDSEAWTPSEGAAARVVVQPDFSVIVIGLNPAPAADLAPFCERNSTGSSQGALVLKITRDSVVKAVSLGLKPAEIIDRLKRHASNEVPANVLREVEEWANWVRRVSTTTLTVVRCPDSATADRVMAALRRQAERLNPTLIALDPKKMTAVERNKLRSHGIIVQKGAEAAERKPKSKKRKS